MRFAFGIRAVSTAPCLQFNFNHIGGIMSKKNAFAAKCREKILSIKGSHHTKEARTKTIGKFSDLVFELGFTHLKDPHDISLKNLVVYVDYRKDEGVEIRTIQNELSHLRSLLRKCGKKELADSPEASNRALGVSGGSRIGKKEPLTNDELNVAYMRSERLQRKGMGCALGLERYLGLRGNEALHALPDTLRRWLRELDSTQIIFVIAGTKGGRTRYVHIKDVGKARAAICHALDVASAQHGFLVMRKNGEAAGGLRQARGIYHTWMHRAGIKPHAARYAFACSNYVAYLGEGFSNREASLLVAADLGHGSGRGRWIRSVYTRSLRGK
jgi:Integrase/Phage integrase, N-terminal